MSLQAVVYSTLAFATLLLVGGVTAYINVSVARVCFDNKPTFVLAAFRDWFCCVWMAERLRDLLGCWWILWYYHRRQRIVPVLQIVRAAGAVQSWYVHFRSTRVFAVPACWQLVSAFAIMYSPLCMFPWMCARSLQCCARCWRSEWVSVL
jgi:hypothetical protein